MKILVAGSRSIENKKLVQKAIENSPFDIDTVVHGDAAGVDTIAKTWAIFQDDVSQIPVEPDYDKYHRKRAPLERNKEMAKMVEAAILVWDHHKETSGTMHMKDILEIEQRMEVIDKHIIDVEDDSAKVFYLQ